MTRPQSIIWFERCYLGAMAVGLTNTAINWAAVQAQVDATPGAGMLPSWFMLATILAGVALNLVLWYFIARRGSNVAKWIVTVLFGIGLASMARNLASGVPLATLNILAWGLLLVQAIAIWMLFRPDAKAWFAGEQAEDLTKTFS